MGEGEGEGNETNLTSPTQWDRVGALFRRPRSSSENDK